MMNDHKQEPVNLEIDDWDEEPACSICYHSHNDGSKMEFYTVHTHDGPSLEEICEDCLRKILYWERLHNRHEQLTIEKIDASGDLVLCAQCEACKYIYPIDEIHDYRGSEICTDCRNAIESVKKLGLL